MKAFGIWKIAIPKTAILRLIDAMDADSDGYISIGEIRDVLKRYGKDAKRSLKFRRE